MKRRYCKCGNEMLVIKKEYAWYWCGKCGRFLNGDQHLDPGDEWLEPLSSHAVLADVRAWVEENKYSHGAFDLEVINVDDLLEYISEHFS